MDKKIRMLLIFYLLFNAIIVRIVLAIPNRKYLSILNFDNIHIIYCAITLFITLIIFLFVKVSELRKMILTITVTIILFVTIGFYYFSNLPQFTYEQAASMVESNEKIKYPSSQLFIPKYREYKVGYREGSFFNVTNHVYYVYLKNEGKNLMFRFDPVDGTYQEAGTRELIE